jgi:uncharacterized protein (DUF305 family)
MRRNPRLPPALIPLPLLLIVWAVGCSTSAASPLPSPEPQASAPAPAVQAQPLAPGEVVRPGAPGEGSRRIPAAEAGPASLPGHSDADVHFMRMMIHHHAQAVEMTALVPDRTRREDMLLLARRIQAAQADEIRWMEQWLERRGEPLSLEAEEVHSGHEAHGGHDRPGGHDRHAGHDPVATDPAPPVHMDHAGMPGMLSRDQLDRLAAARGAEFDLLFLEFMIYHHEGAIVMVQELFASDQGGQDGETYEFAAHVESDQRMEIDRMRSMLARGS